MSITRLHQARQMYAMGQRVGRFAFGGGGSQDHVGGQYQGSGASSTSKGPAGGASKGGIYSGPEDKSSDQQTYNTQVALGTQLPPQLQGPVELNKREQALQNFYNTKPTVKYPSFMPGGIIANTFLKKPLQAFSDFTTQKNRAFFKDVIRAGKIPGVNFGTVSEMSPQQLEKAYQDYMTNRMSGVTDAYGNPNPGYDNNKQGIETLYDYTMFDDVDDVDDIDDIEETTNNVFASRFLQNQPNDIRQDIESKMQNYYTV